jgi:hypothetical protein
MYVRWNSSIDFDDQTYRHIFDLNVAKTIWSFCYSRWFLIFRSYYSNVLWITSRSISLSSWLDHRWFSKSSSFHADFCMRKRFLKCDLLYVFFLYFFCRTTLFSMRCFSWNCSWWFVVKEWLTTICWNIKNSSNLFNKFIDWIHWHIWMLNHECWREWHWIVQKWNKSNVRSV